jgi:hypothetical protein
LIWHNVQRSLAAIGTSIGARGRIARFWSLRLVMVSFSSRESRKSFLWSKRLPSLLGSTWMRCLTVIEWQLADGQGIAEAIAFMRRYLHPLAKSIIVVAPGFVTDRHPAKADGFTSAAALSSYRNASSWCDSVPLGCGGTTNGDGPPRASVALRGSQTEGGRNAAI